MPYIPKDEREEVLYKVSQGSVNYFSAGELNYVITTWVDLHVGEKLSYDKLNDTVATLECIKSRLALKQELIQDDDDRFTVMIGNLVSTWISGDPRRLRTRAIGVLACVRHEFERRVVDPYEDLKCHENGDVYMRREKITIDRYMTEPYTPWPPESQKIQP